MKVVILAGGLGTRLGEETISRPKPMVEIGGMPIIWHIMKIYSQAGFNDFVVALGYRGDLIKRYFLDYTIMNSDIRVRLSDSHVAIDHRHSEPWTIELVETGLNTNTGGRVKRLAERLRNERFMLTYGDGVSNVDIPGLIAFHTQTGKAATITIVRPPARFGEVALDGDAVTSFTEKPQTGEGWINGGFHVYEPAIFDYLDSDEDSLEVNGLYLLARNGQLAGYRHAGFWQCMDTPRDMRYLNGLWESGSPPWRTW